MLATAHLNSGDNVRVYNFTKRNYLIKCSIADGNNNIKIEKILGLNKSEYTINIIISGYCNVEVDDILEIMGKQYRTTNIRTIQETTLCRLRKDYNDFPSTTYVSLIGGDL